MVIDGKSNVCQHFWSRHYWTTNGDIQTATKLMSEPQNIKTELSTISSELNQRSVSIVLFHRVCYFICLSHDRQDTSAQSTHTASIHEVIHLHIVIDRQSRIGPGSPTSCLYGILIHVIYIYDICVNKKTKNKPVENTNPNAKTRILKPNYEPLTKLTNLFVHQPFGNRWKLFLSGCQIKELFVWQ